MDLKEAIRWDRVLLEGEQAVRLLEAIIEMEPICETDPRWDEYQEKWKAREEAIRRYRASLPWKARYLAAVMERLEKCDGKYTPKAREARERFLVYMKCSR
jgi:hypothetical protein